MNKQIEIGSVSTNTLLTRDLMESFLSNLRYYSAPTTGWQKDAETMLLSDSDLEDNELACDVLSALIEELECLAPEGVYFGAHEGDAGDFGFWYSK